MGIWGHFWPLRNICSERGRSRQRGHKGESTKAYQPMWEHTQADHDGGPSIAISETYRSIQAAKGSQTASGAASSVDDGPQNTPFGKSSVILVGRWNLKRLNTVRRNLSPAGEQPTPANISGKQLVQEPDEMEGTEADERGEQCEPWPLIARDRSAHSSIRFIQITLSPSFVCAKRPCSDYSACLQNALFF